MAVAVYTSSGNKATTTAKLDKAVFDVVPTNHDILKTAYLAYLANGRQNLATTKTRGDVRGGGKKPWRQKGTGRARFGSSRVPIWRGGGITFGPTGNENYSNRLSTQTKRLAIRQALSMASHENLIIVIEDFKTKNSKTSEVAKILEKIGAEGNVLFVLENKTPEIKRAFNNLPNVQVIQPKYINVFNTLNADKIILTSKALEEVNAWLGGKA
jgi:large subunit ribosomal protein L4